MAGLVNFLSNALMPQQQVGTTAPVVTHTTNGGNPFGNNPFVNYNGKTKSRSTVKNGAFVGSSVNVIAPVTIGEKAFVCAGTNVDKNVGDNCFAIGRSRMQTKPEKAKKYLEKEN